MSLLIAHGGNLRIGVYHEFEPRKIETMLVYCRDDANTNLLEKQSYGVKHVLYFGHEVLCP